MEHHVCLYASVCPSIAPNKHHIQELFNHISTRKIRTLRGDADRDLDGDRDLDLALQVKFQHSNTNIGPNRA